MVTSVKTIGERAGVTIQKSKEIYRFPNLGRNGMTRESEEARPIA